MINLWWRGLVAVKVTIMADALEWQGLAVWLQWGLGIRKGRAAQIHLLQDLVSVVCLG